LHLEAAPLVFLARFVRPLDGALDVLGTLVDELVEQDLPVLFLGLAASLTSVDPPSHHARRVAR